MLSALQIVKEDLLTHLVAHLVLGAVYALFTAIGLKLLTRISSGFTPRYSDAYFAALVSFFIAYLITLGLSAIALASHARLNSLERWCLIFAGCMVSSAIIYDRMLKDGQPRMGFGRALILALMQFLLFLGVQHYIQPKFGMFSKSHVTADHPDSEAHYASADEAQREAIRRYPELGVAGSRMNLDFVVRHKRYQSESPEKLLDPSWPLRLAEESARAIKGE